jgi:hypothetical protein
MLCILLIISPCGLILTLYTHFTAIAFFLGGSSTKDQVLLLSIHLNSSFMASIHLGFFNASFSLAGSEYARMLHAQDHPFHSLHCQVLIQILAI